jgi:hypothetical protein
VLPRLPRLPDSPSWSCWDGSRTTPSGRLPSSEVHALSTSFHCLVSLSYRSLSADFVVMSAVRRRPNCKGRSYTFLGRRLILFGHVVACCRSIVDFELLSDVVPHCFYDIFAALFALSLDVLGHVLRGDLKIKMEANVIFICGST